MVTRLCVTHWWPQPVSPIQRSLFRAALGAKKTSRIRGKPAATFGADDRGHKNFVHTSELIPVYNEASLLNAVKREGARRDAREELRR